MVFNPSNSSLEPCAVNCSPFTAHRLLFTNSCSLFTVHYDSCLDRLGRLDRLERLERWER